jgi:acyl-ACP thioesterase
VRAADLDVLGHVNNAIALAAVEEVLAGGPTQRVEVEYRDAIEATDDVALVTAPGRMWLTVAGNVRVSALMT